MTDVLIKDLCIPECCMDCDPDFAYAIKCEAYNGNNDFTRQRAENCPLVEIKHSQDGDTISRAEAIETVCNKCPISFKEKCEWKNNGHCSMKVALEALPSAEAKGANLINRHDATTVIREECWKCNRLINADLLGRILALPTSRQTDCTEFIEWLIDIILDDEDWELNAVGYGEIIARKLKKLGLLEVKDGYYVRTPSAEAEWIPCSKGLPKAEYGESDCVLATCCWKSDTTTRWIEKLYFNGGNWCYPTGECFTQKVLAWTPMIETYREDGEA